MQHPLIIPLSPAEQLAALAAGALDAASGQQTRATGSATYHNSDGTKTLIGADAAGQGIAPWVGDTTAPGMPTGISVDSSAGMILVSWDGSLEGGVPADFDHVQILVDGVEAGQLRVRGTAALGPYEADSVHQVTVRAWDDAHAEDGSPAPNGSAESAPVSVTVRSVVDASQVQAAQDKAQEALDKAAGVGRDVQQASKDAQAASVASAQAKQAADAASGKADSAADAAADASSKADSASGKADSAAVVAAAASGKADTALSRGVELVRNPAFDPALGDSDGFGLGMGSSGAPAAPPSPYTTYGALTQRDYFSSWRFPLDRNRKYRFGFWCICDGKGREDLRIGWRYVDSHTHWDEAVTVTQEEASSWVWREAVASTPDQWNDTDHSMSVWLNIAGYGDAATGWWITGLTVRDVTDSQNAKDQASKAQTTADGKNRIFTSASEPSHDGLAKGDLWMQLNAGGNVSGIQIWNGSNFQDYVLMAKQVLVAGSVGTINLENGAITADKVTASEALLEKLLVRKIKADEVDVGLLSAAIVQSGRFVTPNGLTGFDETGFWSKDENGNTIFRASSSGVQASGGFVTANSGDRIQLSQTTIQGTNVGGLQGIGDDPNHPYWLIWGEHEKSGNTIQSKLFVGTSPQQPEFTATISDTTNTASVIAKTVDITGDDVHLGGGHGLHLDAGSIWARGVRLPVSLHAWGGYADHAGAWEISLRSAKARYGDQPAVIAPALQAAGLRIPVSGYWLVYGSINIGGSGTPTVSLGVYDQASKSITSYGEGYIADFSTSANTWLTQVMPPTLQWLDAGDVIMWRTSAGVNIGGGANSLCADLMPY